MTGHLIDGFDPAVRERRPGWAAGDSNPEPMECTRSGCLRSDTRSDGSWRPAEVSFGTVRCGTSLLYCSAPVQFADLRITSP